MPTHGGCLCKAVRYQLNAAPIVTRICWCRVCQYIAAGSGTVNVAFAREALSVSGELGEFVMAADSGNVMRRRFCPKCGTHLFTASDARPQLIFLRAGSLDDPELARPAMTIWTQSAPSWACISTEIPRVERQPPPPTPTLT
jgi:hypothetical protein